MVKALKYRFVQVVASDIGAIMATYFEQRASLIGLDPKNLTISSVPLHPRRLRWRGFNQAKLIANAIGKELGLSVRHDLLKRTVYKSPQADIEDRVERIKNAENIFAVGPLVAVRPLTRTVLLVDDVATTASTLNNAARVLKDAGAKNVIGFVFARG
ncbi:MAG: phosphoribosyltransferase family protein [Patescibacteria group bacterium]